ncbi:sialidase family protein [Chitinophaga qingshengii]|uniref:Exo-alpha-sialidase n=1 Tax=Chitinophaga qingshengii TaxID=1569794 RepID=A0ABR7THJ8_9BACT|nr:sialidase family protein [Chitinophaga qingshengii]MBC9928991.1 exo-alpha-sialidase [Chitinophaga qingshengii]
MKNIVFIACLLLGSSSFAQQQHSQVPGVVINHVSAREKLYIGSPGICILPDGNYLASHEYFGPERTGKSKVQIFRSVNKGMSWEKIAEIDGQEWSALFTYHNDAFILGPEMAGGDIVIRRSTDGGYSWSQPTTAAQGRLFKGRFHSAPTPVLIYKNRIWKAMEDLNGPGGKWGRAFRSFMLSAPVDADLLQAGNWTMSNTLGYDSGYLNGNMGGWLEGNAVAAPGGKVVTMLRTDYRVNGDEKAAIIQVSDDGKQTTFDPATGFIDFPGACKKFSVRYDSVSHRYWTLSNYVPGRFRGGNPERTRNTVALLSSADLKTWQVQGIVLHHPDVEKHGFQYLDFQFEGKDMIAVSRTAFDDADGGADNQHNANYLTFHRISNFRHYKTPRKWRQLMP